MAYQASRCIQIDTSREAKFWFYLTRHVLKFHKLVEVYAIEYDGMEDLFDIEVKGNKKKSTIRRRNANKNAFCEHIGNAVLAAQHLYRLEFKQILDTFFPIMVKGEKKFKQCMLSLIDKYFTNGKSTIGKMNDFIAMCAFLNEVNVYCTFRDCYESVRVVRVFFVETFKIAFKEEFELHGGWKLLRQVARPWWKCFEEATVKGVELKKPEYVYFIVESSGKKVEIVIHEIYEDIGDTSDHKYDPPNPNEDPNNVAISNNGCYYYCRQLPRFDVSLSDQETPFFGKLKTSLANIRNTNPSGESSTAGSPVHATTAATGSTVPGKSGASESHVPAAPAAAGSPVPGKPGATGSHVLATPAATGSPASYKLGATVSPVNVTPAATGLSEASLRFSLKRLPPLESHSLLLLIRAGFLPRYMLTKQRREECEEEAKHRAIMEIVGKYKNLTT